MFRSKAHTDVTRPERTQRARRHRTPTRNQYWPAQHIVDQNGKIVFEHDGEGQYEQIERTIARLLGANR